MGSAYQQITRSVLRFAGANSSSLVIGLQEVQCGLGPFVFFLGPWLLVKNKKQKTKNKKQKTKTKTKTKTKPAKNNLMDESFFLNDRKCKSSKIE
jgi:hypothetical protein